MALELNIHSMIKDFARPNLFFVEIPYLGPDTKYFIKASSLPASTLGPIEVGFQGRKIKVAGDRTFDDWTVTVLNPENHTIRQSFLEWSNLIVTQNRTISGTQADEYKKDGYIYQYGRDGEETVKYIIKGMWPQNVGEIGLDWDDNDVIENFEVTLSYDWWEPV